MSSPSWRELERAIVACDRCPRLRSWCAEVARVKRRSYADEEYWGRPVPGFGDIRARLLVVGLAPGAHGANRTGRIFTGDSSGDWLYRALHETGFANQPESLGRGDGLALRDAYVTASARCAPPDNRPLPEEVERCREYIEREVALLSGLKVAVALGRLAFDNWLTVLQRRDLALRRGAYPFEHGAEYEFAAAPRLIASYHPSRQNTQTGRLSREMLRDIFLRARVALDESAR